MIFFFFFFAKVQAQCEDAAIASWHIHMNFHPNDVISSATAVSLRESYVERFNASECPFAHSQLAENVSETCAFPLEWPVDGPYAGAGPFDLPNFSVFVPKALLEEVMAFFLQKRDKLPMFVHPNSGCQDLDHSVWPVVAGQLTTDLSGLACCREGPAGCACYTAMYEGPNETCLSYADGVLTVDTTCNTSDPAATAVWAETNHTPARHSLDAFALQPTRCLAYDCYLKSAFLAPDCRNASVSYVVDDRTFRADACPDLCLALQEDARGEGRRLGLADCGAATRFGRKCLFGPGTTPADCPSVQY
ncbi:hypothetical protein CTAYLR_002851 [Chrysophaeum taylorii]|uniref:Uncharacterized protein n=1 Tax=Chrysophaeum taylorii TaxID=2483200 RepID=A0AAD7UA29_9STRA|nr:hypothetical protein CTAYLR_002851 [Chrysophaeum taylorii]